MSDVTEELTFSSLDPSQKNTFESIVNGTDNLHIVHGPPGTGKSQLVVSLLEGLAARGKRVLFVSQNTEALRVIERMVVKTQKDIGYPSENKYLSLLDFCLMLYEPKHRQLKYLREQYSNLSAKQLPVLNKAQKPFNADFKLRYTNLDHNANYNIKGAEVGFDELVGYFIKYVNQAIAPEPLREIENVNIRQVFEALDSYRNSEHFPEYNMPKRELTLLSSKGADITLPAVRQSLQDIKQVINGEWVKHFAAKEDIDVLDYLNHLKEYSSFAQYFDAYRFATENIDVESLKMTIKELIDRSDRISGKITVLEEKHKDTAQKASLDIQGITAETDSILLGNAVFKSLHEDINNVVSGKNRIVTLIRETVTKYPDVEYASINDVWLGLGRELSDVFRKQVDSTEAVIGNKAITNLHESINSLTKTELETLNNDMREFAEKIMSMGTIKRMLASVPPALKKQFNITLVGDFEKFYDGLSPILSLLPDVMHDGDTVGSLTTYKDEPSVSLRKLQITVSSNTQDLISAFEPVNELVVLLKKYEIKAKPYAQMKQEVAVLHRSLTSLVRIANTLENKKFFIGSQLEEIIDATNILIEAAGHEREKIKLEHDNRDMWNDAYNTHQQLFANIQSTDAFKTLIPEVFTYLTHKSDQIPKLLNAISVPEHIIRPDADLEKIESTLLAINSTDHFSDDFFTIRANSTIQKWLDTISVLETYNNDVEVIEYTQHNKSIKRIKNALGAANFKYVDSILTNDLSFNSFAARIVNAVVGEVFGRSNATQRTRISTTDLLKAYEKHLKSERAMHYRDTLLELHKTTMTATRELSKQTTLQASGKSTMEKFRHNTKIITEAFPVMCATPKDIAKYVAPSKAVFDFVIFDEASQLLPGQAIPSIYRAQKTVIIGDPHQMPPNLNATFSLVEQGEDDFDDLGESILDLVLKQPQKQHHLKVHYRSRYNKLFEPSRQAIYSASGVEPIFEAELANGAPIDILDDLGDEVDEFGYDKNFAKVCESVEEYLESDESADFCVLFTTGGVLQSFRNYIEDVGYRKFHKVSELYNKDKILLSTVTNCQGIEGTYTVLYMHHYSRPGAMWFFKEQAGAYKRLNVSITRQREGLKLLLADPRAHWIATCDQKINADSAGPNATLSAQLMKSLLTNAGEKADETYLERTLGENTAWFDSPLTEQLYIKLTKYYEDKLGRQLKIYSEVGWNLVIPRGESIEENERNVGFRIDLGIYSPIKKRFVLGIEMDGAMYHSGYEKEHSDYTRQKVLESKGWDIYRIWSTNWLLDMDKEFDRLTQTIDKALSTDA